MADITLDRIIKDAFSLPPQDQRRLIELLNARMAQSASVQTIEQMAAEQGKAPLDFARIQKLGSFFPADENVDDLVNTIRSLRDDKATRTLD